MKASDLTIEVSANLTVSKTTAEACLKLVELYLNTHEDFYVEVKRNADGTHTFELRKYTSETTCGKE